MTEKIDLCIRDEFARLEHVIVGTAEGYHRDPNRVEVVNNAQRRLLAANGGHPAQASLKIEFQSFIATLEGLGVHVYQPDLAPDTVQDQTCPRDIGFVIGDTLVIATMRPISRRDEFEGVRHLADHWRGRIIQAPADVFIEGGDVIVDGQHVFVGYGQRSNAAGMAFMEAEFGARFEIVPLPCRSAGDGEDILHLDCTFNPLGLGHALIYPAGLAGIPEVLREKYTWIEVDRVEADALATNVLSVAPNTVIARSAPACARVNAELKKAGYRVVEVGFDGVPATGGSFRCATMPLRRGL